MSEAPVFVFDYNGRVIPTDSSFQRAAISERTCMALRLMSWSKEVSAT